MPLPSNFFLAIETFSLLLEKNLMGVALLLPTFLPSRNGNSGPTPHATFKFVWVLKAAI